MITTPNKIDLSKEEKSELRNLFISAWNRAKAYDGSFEKFAELRTELNRIFDYIQDKSKEYPTPEIQACFAQAAFGDRKRRNLENIDTIDKIDAYAFRIFNEKVKRGTVINERFLYLMTEKYIEKYGQLPISNENNFVMCGLTFSRINQRMKWGHTRFRSILHFFSHYFPEHMAKRKSFGPYKRLEDCPSMKKP